MANFDSKKWYQVTLKGYENSNLLSLASQSTNGSGSAFFQITNTSSANQQWQLFPSTNNTFVLRSGESGEFGYLSARAGTVDKSSVNAGNTVPVVTNYAHVDISMYWTISPWGDGSFWMENSANGSAWHLEKEANGLMIMSSNITKPQTGQQFLFKPLKAITNSKFSTLKTPPSTTSASPSTSSIILPTSTSTSSSSADGSSSGLSIGAKAGIGAGIGAIALITLLLSLFLFLNRRKRTAAKTSTEYEYVGSSIPNVKDHEMWPPKTHSQVAELSSEGQTLWNCSAELPANSPPNFAPVELDSAQRGAK